MNPLQVTLSLVGIVIIIIAAYYVTWFIGAKASGQSRGKLRNKKISIIDRFAVSKDKSFCLVEIAGKVYVVGITNQSMTLLDTLEPSLFTKTETERSDGNAWKIVPEDRLMSRMIKRFASFIGQKMGRQPEASAAGGGSFAGGTSVSGVSGSDISGSGAAFADSMRNAQMKNTAGQADRVQTKRSNDPEGEE